MRPVALGQMVRGGRSRPSATLRGGVTDTGGKPALGGGELRTVRGGGGVATVRLHAAHRLQLPDASCDARALDSCEGASVTTPRAAS